MLLSLSLIEQNTSIREKACEFDESPFKKCKQYKMKEMLSLVALVLNVRTTVILD